MAPRPQIVYSSSLTSRLAKEFKLEKLRKYDGKENPES
jgi:hypothetical protein